MTYAWYDLVGTLGVAIIVLTYVLLQAGKVRREQLSYSVLNGFGAVMILVSLYFEFNFPSFVVESFWLLISLFGVAKYFLRR